ncbi:hypothetical protein [Trinickia fusca]|uniref:Uncharacterized protein n=1 Tax=Trinickia fusca TaxID=2419777 RepID=A0A494XRP8_9BURK|nr:hypothetical protein [Trinickia fusca]RKP52502.1 hypothetical protein D7S89_03045 [Trinickia fusca]
MIGNGLSASLIGAPDLGLLTMSEMVERGRAFADAVDVKLLSFPVSSTLAYAGMMTLLAEHVRVRGTTAASPQPLMPLDEYDAVLGRSGYA